MDALGRVVKEYLVAMGTRFWDLPHNYLVLDLETTGFSHKEDVIVQIGHCLVKGGQAVDTAAFIFDWTQDPRVTLAWLEDRLDRTKRHVELDKLNRPTGRTYPFSLSRLRTDGTNPEETLRFYMGWLHELHESGYFIVTHNGYNFDCKMLERHFFHMLETLFQFDDREVFDTGMAIKAAQLNYRFENGETPRAFSARASRYNPKGLQWSLDRFCIPHFQLQTKHNLDVRNAHSADFDCLATHFLFQECLKAAGISPVSK